jgi:PAS domain S-box-containing protein
LYWVFSAPWRAWGADGRRYAEAIFLLACVMVTGYLAANTPASSIYFAAARFYAPVPFLFWAAIRFGIPGAAGAMAVMAVFAVEAAMVGNGPFAGRSPADTALLLQNFLLLRSVPLYFVAALVDQMRAAERTVRESEERFRRLAHSAPTLIWLAGTDKLCEFVNQYWQDFTGRSLEQELGDGWTKGIHPEDYNYCVDGYFSAFDARKAFELEYRLRRHDGEYRWILDKGIPRYSQTGDFIGYVGSALDITDLKRAQETSRALAHAHRLAVMGELTATIAHEVRQPLSAISLNAQAAGKLIDMDNPPLQDLREMVLDIRDSVLRVDAVIARIRAYLQKREVRMEAVDPNLVAHDVLWLLTSDAQRRGVRLQSDLGRDLPLILADRTQLQQVLLNLIVNSMDAMADVPELQRSIGIQTKRARADQVEFIVTDRGCGIPADQLTQLFESFFTSGPDSMGLGLSVARSLVEAHQGRIWAENNASGGAAFHFTIPVARPGAHREAQAVADAVLE